MKKRMSVSYTHLDVYKRQVDIGLHEDGLVHISKMSKQRVSHPSELVAVGDIVKVWVYNIDEEKQKVQLSFLQP